jgi:hypothetical protein
VLWLNTALAEGSFQIHEFEVRLNELEIERETISEQLVGLAEPQALAARAAELGMIESPATGYIILSDGLIIGSPPPAGDEDAAGDEADSPTGAGDEGAAGQ